MGVYYKINEEILTDIANAIRQRGSTSAQMAPQSMAANILAIPDPEPPAPTGGPFKELVEGTLSTIVDDTCSVIAPSVFAENQQLTNVTFNEVLNINSYAFQYASVVNASFPKCNIIYNKAFYTCPNLQTVNIPNCTLIYPSAFQSCSNLRQINITSATSICGYAF